MPYEFGLSTVESSNNNKELQKIIDERNKLIFNRSELSNDALDALKILEKLIYNKPNTSNTPNTSNNYDLVQKINSTEFNSDFEKVILEKLETEYRVTYYGIYNLKTEKIVSFSNSNDVTTHIKNNITVTQQKVNVVEYQSPMDLLLDGQLNNGGIEIDIKYKEISLYNDTILLDDYKYGAELEDKLEFIKDFVPKMENNYINYLAHIFENMKKTDK